MAIRSLKSGIFSRSAMVGNTLIYPGSFESIASVDVGAGGSSTITFSSIPSTYTHLQIRMTSLQTNATSGGTMSFNSDTTTSNYYYHYLLGNGSAASAGAGQDRPYAPWNSGSSSGPGATIVDILDYSNTNKYKTLRALNGYDLNGSGAILLTSNLWSNTAAISTITITSAGFLQYSSFALYGVN
jgi:hypothetical protein